MLTTYTKESENRELERHNDIDYHFFAYDNHRTESYPMPPQEDMHEFYLNRIGAVLNGYTVVSVEAFSVDERHEHKSFPEWMPADIIIIRARKGENQREIRIRPQFGINRYGEDIYLRAVYTEYYVW